MRAIALANQKGGVGKTTSTVSLGACLARRGRKVLLIDIDPQANLSIHLGVNVHEDRPSAYALLTGQAGVEEVIQSSHIEGLDIIPSDINLAGAEIELVGMVGRETMLKEALAPVLDNYDYILIDCPPSLGLLTLNALTTVKELFIPLQTEFFALHGMSKLLETVSIVKRRLNPDLEITGIIPCLFDTRTNLAHEVLENIQQYFGDRVFKTIIRKNIRLAEAPSYGKSIIDYDTESSGARDYSSLADEVIAREPDGRPRPAATPSIDEPAADEPASEMELEAQAGADEPGNPEEECEPEFAVADADDPPETHENQPSESAVEPAPDSEERSEECCEDCADSKPDEQQTEPADEDSSAPSDEGGADEVPADDERREATGEYRG